MCRQLTTIKQALQHKHLAKELQPNWEACVVRDAAIASGLKATCCPMSATLNDYIYRGSLALYVSKVHVANVNMFKVTSKH